MDTQIQGIRSPVIYAPKGKTGILAKFVTVIRTILALVIVGALVAVAGALFLAIVILNRVLRIVGLTTRGAAGASTFFVVNLISNILARIIGFVVVSLMVGALVYLALEYNPQLRTDVNSLIASAEQKVEKISGIRLPNFAFPTLQEMWDMITRKGSPDNPNPIYLDSAHLPDAIRNLKPDEVERRIRELQGMPKLPQDAAKELEQLKQLQKVKLPEMKLPDVHGMGKLTDVLPSGALPKELQPLMGVAMDPETLKTFQTLAKEGGITPRSADAAIPVLKNALYGNNAQLSGASFQALKSIQSPEAKAAVAEYQKLMEQIAKDAKLGR